VGGTMTLDEAFSHAPQGLVWTVGKRRISAGGDQREQSCCGSLQSRGTARRL